jgi:hypothetical protein
MFRQPFESSRAILRGVPHAWSSEWRVLSVFGGAVGAFVFIWPVACSKNTSGRWFEKPKTSQEWLDMALEAPQADDRRRGVIGLARSQDGRSEWALKVYDTIARTDNDTMVRCAAVKAMGPTAGSEQVPTLLKILSSQTVRQAEVRPAAGALRWEAAKVLLAVVDGSRYAPSQRADIVKSLLERLTKDNDRNVRLTAIDTLAYFAESPVPAALVEALHEDDYAIQHGAELSLIALTGVTHHHDAAAWRAWLNSVKDPFEKAGQIPEGAHAAHHKRRWQWDWEF